MKEKKQINDKTEKSNIENIAPKQSKTPTTKH